MKNQLTITYYYDPAARSLTLYSNGKTSGGFIGPLAERKFQELLLTGEQINITNMTTEGEKKTLIRRFHACLANQGIMKHKADIISRFGVEHTTDLTTDQLKELVDEYSGKRQVDNARTRVLRSDLLTLCNKMEIYVNNTDWSKVNEFFMKHTGKLLYQLDEAELIKARKQFNSILTWHINKTESINRQKLMN